MFKESLASHRKTEATRVIAVSASLLVAACGAGSEPARFAFGDGVGVVEETRQVAQLAELETDLTDGSDPNAQIEITLPEDYVRRSEALCEAIVGTGEELSVVYGHDVVLVQGAAIRGGDRGSVAVHCVYENGPGFVRLAMSPPFVDELRGPDRIIGQWGSLSEVGIYSPATGVVAAFQYVPDDPTDFLEEIARRVESDIAS